MDKLERMLLNWEKPERVGVMLPGTMMTCDKAAAAIRAALNPPIGELGPDGKEWAKTSAGFDHVEAVKHRADGWHGLAPWFHGWAVREAFVAGAEWQEQRRKTDG
ncbi:MAG: hypothetical protein E5V54_22740 [Mesorhizobium sp.]|nr:MAG: hypothetical protein E5V54_22740 [Mesorhizobium sp.]